MEICESDEYLRTIIRSSIDGIAVVDEDGRIEFGNESFFNITGWSREELIGHFFIDVFPVECHEFLKGRWRGLESGIGLSYETRIRTKEGEIRFIYISHSQTEIGGRKRYVAIIKDISEKKKLESELKISEAKYRDLFENAVDSIYINDAEGNILNVNKATLERLRCSAEDIIGSHVSKWFTPESWRLTQETMRKRLLGEPADDPMIRQIVAKDGECGWAEIRSRLIKDGDRVVGYQGIGRDITEKVRMQQELKEYQEKLEISNKELRESEAKYRELFENAQDIMYVVDNEGNFLEINQSGCQILGCKKEELIGNNFAKWMTAESLKITNDRRKKYASGEILNVPDILELVSGNGEHRWIEVKIRSIKGGNTKTEIHGIARDVTENVRLKQELKKSNKQRKVLCHLIQGTRGGKTRALILKNLTGRSYNAHQLTKALNMDYKTIRHHLDVLIKNGIITKDDNGGNTLYFIPKTMELTLHDFRQELQDY